MANGQTDACLFSPEVQEQRIEFRMIHVGVSKNRGKKPKMDGL